MWWWRKIFISKDFSRHTCFWHFQDGCHTTPRQEIKGRTDLKSVSLTEQFDRSIAGKARV